MQQNRREFLINQMRPVDDGARHAGPAFRSNERDGAASRSRNENAVAVPNDYRALVCIFLLGGNDGNNTVIPLHSDANLSNYALYSALRAPQGLAFAQNVPLPFLVPRLGNLTYGFHPALGVGATNNGLYELWGQNKLAVVSNVGTLVRPTTKRRCTISRTRSPTICIRIPTRRRSIRAGAAIDRFRPAGRDGSPISGPAPTTRMRRYR
jgi:uncharacterized protein (DUF1501 family)